METWSSTELRRVRLYAPEGGGAADQCGCVRSATLWLVLLQVSVVFRRPPMCLRD